MSFKHNKTLEILSAVSLLFDFHFSFTKGLSPGISCQFSHKWENLGFICPIVEEILPLIQ